MTSGRTFVLAVAVTAVAAGLAIRRRARRHDAVGDRTELQSWENEGGSTVPPEVVQPPPS